MSRGFDPIDPQQIIDPPTQGAESNHSGKFLEEAIEKEFRNRGVRAFPFSAQGNNGALFDTHFLLKRVPYRSIYGCNSYSEFAYRHFFKKIDIRIECRWQQCAGSVDEKLPYLLMNASAAMPESEIWLVISGGGARNHALEWTRTAASNIKEKLIHVLDLSDARKAIKYLIDNGKGLPRASVKPRKKLVLTGLTRKSVDIGQVMNPGPLFTKTP